VREHVAPYFDFEAMSRLAIGSRTWQAADASQREQFVLEFRELLVRTYGLVLLQYRGEEVHFQKPEVLDGHGRIEMVRTKVFHKSSQPPTPVDYVLVKRQDWHVVDVLIDGISIVTTHSTSFQDAIRRGGLPALISDLHRLNESTRSR